MKWYNCFIWMAFALALVVLVAMGSGCGTTIIEKTVTETVTASPSPSASSSQTPSTYFTPNEIEGLAVFAVLTDELQHTYNDEEKARAYAARTGNISGFLDRAGHYADEYRTVRKEYEASNGGEFYGGKLHRLESLFEDAAHHVSKYGKGLINVATSNNYSVSAIAQQAIWAESGLQHLKTELERLTALQDTSN